jgi:hypothetical protein
MSNKWIYPVLGVGVASAIVYLLVYKKDKPYEPPPQPTLTDTDPDTGFTYEQATIDTNLSIYLQASQNQQKTTEIYSSGPAKGKRFFTNNRIKDKQIATKVDGVKLRSYPHVNNGFINNILAELDKDVVLGKANYVTSEMDKIKGADGITINPKNQEPYKWVSITLSDATTDLINSKRSWFIGNLNKGLKVFTREDTVKIV